MLSSFMMRHRKAETMKSIVAFRCLPHLLSVVRRSIVRRLNLKAICSSRSQLPGSNWCLLFEARTDLTWQCAFIGIILRLRLAAYWTEKKVLRLWALHFHNSHRDRMSHWSGLLSSLRPCANKKRFSRSKMKIITIWLTNASPHPGW